MELHCPQCQHVLDQDNGHARCRSCGEFIEMKALCPDCHQPLQVLMNLFTRFFYRLDVFYFTFYPAVFQTCG